MREVLRNAGLNDLNEYMDILSSPIPLLPSLSLSTPFSNPLAHLSPLLNPLTKL
jgi:hypothetical protein